MLFPTPSRRRAERHPHPVLTVCVSLWQDLKEIGLPVGPRVKLRNWIKSQISQGGGAAPVGSAGAASAQGQGPNQGA